MAGPDSESVSNHKWLQAFINRLRDDFATHPDSWESVTLDDHLEAIEAWLHDLDGVCQPRERVATSGNLGVHGRDAARREDLRVTSDCSISFRHGL